MLKMSLPMLSRFFFPQHLILGLRRLVAKAQGDAEQPEADLDVDSSPAAEEDQAHEPVSEESI